MIRLIASDMDGTLLNSRGELNTEIYNIIGELKRLGIIFAVASGRQLASLKKSFGPVEEDVLYLAENGTYVVYRDKEIYSNVIERKLVYEIIDKIKGIGENAYILCGKKSAYCIDKDLAEYMRKPKFGYEIAQINSIDDIEDEILKISLFDSEDAREHSYKLIKPIYGEKMDVVTSGYNCLDIMNLNANKGTAIKEICKSFGIDRRDVISFGDNYNDLEMFDESGISYVMLNADEYVRSRADRVIGSNDDDSVIKTLKSIIKEIY